EALRVGVVELGVVRDRLCAALAALDDRAHFSTDGDAVVERGSDSLRGEGQALPRRVSGEEDAAFGRRPQLVRDPVALIANPLVAEVARELVGSLADVG